MGASSDHSDGRIRLAGLTGLDERELRGLLPPECVTFGHEGASGGDYGDLATTTAVMIVGSDALRILASWLAQTRSRSAAEQIVEMETPDGRRFKRTVRLRHSDSAAPSPEVLSALNAMVADPSGTGTAPAS